MEPTRFTGTSDGRDSTGSAQRGGIVLAPDAAARTKILVVEDEHLVALDVLKVIARMGHVAVVAYSSEEAIQKVAASHFDLVLMDVKLKGAIDGIEAARIIRASHDIPVIYVTAFADDETLDRARVTEPYGYVVKPFNERELTAAISMGLQRYAVDKLRGEQQQLRQFLGDATARMAASLDYRVVARGAAELIVPQYADWCLVHLAESAEEIPSFTCSRSEIGDVAEETGSDGAPPPIVMVERNLRSELLTELTDAELLAALGPVHATAVHALGPRSLLCVPLVARGQQLGALAMVAGSTRAPYGAVEVSFIEDFAHRLAMALDNALLYRKAERAVRMRDDVLAIVSHDLRSPLGAIILRANTIAAEPELAKTAGWIVRAAKQMNRLIDDLLDASAINNGGKLALVTGAHGAAELVHDAVGMFRLHAQASAISLTLELLDSSIRIDCDRDRIVQVLANLIGNALKFTPEHGAVTVSAELRGSDVRFEVRDTGPGIAAAQIPHLFERFWRVESRRSGVGLGLFIANGIVASHGSRLGVESTLGVGTTVFFSLPVSPS